MTTLATFKHLASIKIENFIREVEVSSSQNAKYFFWDEQKETIRAKGKPLFKKYIKKDNINTIAQRPGNKVYPQDLKDTFRIVGFKGTKPYCLVKAYASLTGILIMEDVVDSLTDKQYEKPTKFFLVDWNYSLEEVGYGDRIIANPTQVNKAKKLVVSGQGLYSGTYHEFERVKIVDALKLMYFKKFLQIPWNKVELLIKTLNGNYPLWILVEIQDTVKRFNDKTKEGHGRRWDVSNIAYPYLKTFTDFLVDGYTGANAGICSIIEDDDRLHVMGDANIFTPIEEGETHTLIFHIYGDKRKLWKPILNL